MSPGGNSSVRGGPLVYVLHQINSQIQCTKGALLNLQHNKVQQGCVFLQYVYHAFS